MLLIVLFSLSGWLAANPPATEKVDSTVLDKRWLLRKMMENDSMRYDIDENSLWIEFKHTENKLFGQAPCNTFFGAFNTDYLSPIQLMAVGNTRTYCEQMRYETLYLSLLQQVDHFLIRHEKLILMKGQKVLLVFEH